MASRSLVIGDLQIAQKCIFVDQSNFKLMPTRPLVAGEDSGDQFAEIVDLLGPPDPDMMEAMGVEDAVS